MRAAQEGFEQAIVPEVCIFTGIRVGEDRRVVPKIRRRTRYDRSVVVQALIPTTVARPGGYARRSSEDITFIDDRIPAKDETVAKLAPIDSSRLTDDRRCVVVEIIRAISPTAPSAKYCTIDSDEVAAGAVYGVAEPLAIIQVTAAPTTPLASGVSDSLLMMASPRLREWAWCYL